MMVYLFYFPSIMFLFSYHFLSRFPGVKYTVLVQSCMYLCSIIIIYHNRSSHDDFVSICNRNTSIVLLHIIDLMRPTIAWWELFTAITFYVQHDGHSPFRLSAYVACSCTIQCPFLYIWQRRVDTLRYVSVFPCSTPSHSSVVLLVLHLARWLVAPYATQWPISLFFCPTNYRPLPWFCKVLVRANWRGY